MFKTKSLAAILLVVAVLFAQVGTVFAAPSQTTPPITGTIQDVQTQTDANNVTTVLVTVLDPTTNTTQTVRISVDTAVGLGLLQLDPVTQQPILDPTTNEPLVDQTKFGQPVSIDPLTVIPDQPTEETVHPIAAILAKLFEVDPLVVNQYHLDGFGFGVIAQALWMAEGLKTDNPEITAGLILEAKQNKDFSAFVLPDGSTPTNWGQFKRAALGKDKKNLGIIVSGHVQTLDETTTTNSLDKHGNGKDKHQNKGNGQGNKP